jgi:hypothetical protein
MCLYESLLHTANPLTACGTNPLTGLAQGKLEAGYNLTINDAFQLATGIN